MGGGRERGERVGQHAAVAAASGMAESLSKNYGGEVGSGGWWMLLAKNYLLILHDKRLKVAWRCSQLSHCEGT